MQNSQEDNTSYVIGGREPTPILCYLLTSLIVKSIREA